MLLRIAVYTFLYRLVHVYRILRERAMYCHRTYINCHISGSYKVYGRSMAPSLESYTPGQDSTKWYKAVYPAMRDSMLFLGMLYCSMYSLVP
jgi:hypothetical protein